MATSASRDAENRDEFVAGVLARIGVAPEVVSGDEVFKLYDSLGVPFDFVEDLAGQRGLTIDRDAYDAAMNARKSGATSCGRRSMIQLAERTPSAPARSTAVRCASASIPGCARSMR